MARIDPELLQRLQDKLNIKRAQVYKRIEHTANRTRLDRHLAALVFAAENQINLNRYSTAEERAVIRGVSVDSTPSSPVAKAETVKTTKEPRGKKRKVSPKDNSVFVVHGRNEKLRKSLFELLRAFGLNPLEWEKALLKTKGNNPYVGHVLDEAMAKVQAVVVLFTPDDEARLKSEFCGAHEKSTEGSLQGQPRPNVIFEAGLALGRHEEKTLLVQVGKIRDISDIFGKHIIRLSNDPKKRIDFANRLKKIGCTVDTAGTDWLHEGDFG